MKYVYCVYEICIPLTSKNGAATYKADCQLPIVVDYGTLTHAAALVAVTHHSFSIYKS